MTATLKEIFPFTKNIFNTNEVVANMFQELINYNYKLQLCLQWFKIQGTRSVRGILCVHGLNPLSANPTKWPNTIKQFVGKLPTNCLSVFDHFVKLALKGFNSLTKQKTKCYIQCDHTKKVCCYNCIKLPITIAKFGKRQKSCGNFQQHAIKMFFFLELLQKELYLLHCFQSHNKLQQIGV